MKNYTERKINVFFVEIIIVIFFLMITSTILASIYASANSKINDSKLLSDIVIDANSFAEVYSIEHDIEKSVKQVYGISDDIVKTDNKYSVSLKDGVILEINEELQESNAGILKKIYLEYKKGKKIFFDMNSSSYECK